MNRKILFWPLAAVLLTACEKGLDVGVDGMSPDGGLVKNSVLQVRTRAGGAVADTATVAYPATVYVFRGDECRTVQTIGGEGCVDGISDWRLPTYDELNAIYTALVVSVFATMQNSCPGFWLSAQKSITLHKIFS